MTTQSFLFRTPAKNAQSEWIDCMKGGGILLVAAAHIVLYDTLYRDIIHIFHMPLFFFISGYLLKPDLDSYGYFVKKLKHLVVPYFAFLILLGAPSMVKMSMIGEGGQQFLQLLAGGKGIGGTMAVLWFVTCLFFTQQLMNFLLARRGRVAVAIVVFIGLSISYVNLLYPDFWLPLNIHVVPAAMPYVFLGYLFQRTALKGKIVLLAWTGAFIAVTMVLFGIHVEQDMKSNLYGIPYLSFVLALCLIVAFMHFHSYLSRTKIIGPVFASLGQYSMGIMFLHMPIAVAMRNWLPTYGETIRFISAVALSYGIARALDRFSLTRSIFLGSARPVAPSVRKIVSPVAT
jgi:fucose 4-O-acetylase-like acetyltransferase